MRRSGAASRPSYPRPRAPSRRPRGALRGRPSRRRAAGDRAPSGRACPLRTRPGRLVEESPRERLRAGKHDVRLRRERWSVARGAEREDEREGLVDPGARPFARAADADAHPRMAAITWMSSIVRKGLSASSYPSPGKSSPSPIATASKVAFAWVIPGTYGKGGASLTVTPSRPAGTRATRRRLRPFGSAPTLATTRRTSAASPSVTHDFAPESTYRALRGASADWIARGDRRLPPWRRGLRGHLRDALRIQPRSAAS